MVGKAQTRRIRIGNDGDAVLTIPKFSIEGSASGAFERGPGWPSEAIEILPEENFYLSVVFNPPSEETFSSVLKIQTSIGDHVLELVGTGREAVLTVSVNDMIFDNCLVGNEYIQDFTVINAGDLIYPINSFVMQIDEDLGEVPDIEVVPKECKITPFAKQKLRVIFKPTMPCEDVYTLVVNSVYSRCVSPGRYENHDNARHAMRTI